MGTKTLMHRANTIWKRDLAAAAALGAAVAVLFAVARLPHSGLSGGASSASLVQGARYLTDLRIRLHEPSGPLASQSLRSDALQAIYLARIETSLGSPFRAIEAASRDPWLPDSVRPALASAMLASALVVEPGGAGGLSVEPFHAALVDSIVRAHPEPRRGEEIVRVAFDLAAASGAISHAEAAAAGELAAVARDAVHTRRDIARLVAAAHKGGVGAIELLPLWRQERRFEVERPIVYPLAWAASRELISNAARVFEQLDARARVQRGSTATDSQDRPAFVVSYTVRQSALQVARARNAPPVPAVVQTTAALPAGRSLSTATTEEELAAAWLNVANLALSERRASARAIVAAAVRLRTMGQDPVWFSGDEGPRVSDLQARHGLRAVTFASALRPAWRDYALHSIDHALSDARRVLPELDLRGLRIHVGLKAEWPTRAMALHDPETRTIYFPLGTAPGVLAHELGHDLDWQVARSVFGEQGIYATDGAARRTSQILAAPVERLTSSPAGGARAAARQPHSTRPTEVMARHVDWIIAAGLATMGRSNGFLSTVQEGGDALGNTATPDVGQIDAAVSVLSTATRVPERMVQQMHAGTSVAPLVREVVHNALATTLRMPWNYRAASPFDAVNAASSVFRQATDPRLARRCVAALARAAGEPEWIGDVHALVADARSRDVIRRMQQGLPRRPLARDGALARASLTAGPIDPLLRTQSVSLLRREIEWQLAAAMVSPLVQASAVPTCSS